MANRSQGVRNTVSVLALIFGFLSSVVDLRAGDLVSGCRPGECDCVRRTTLNGWKVIESHSFRIHHVGASAVPERLLTVCEKTRCSLRARWLNDNGGADWSPKCDVFLYPSGSEFQRLTRFPAEMWGAADLEIGNGRVWQRRLYMRADDAKRLDKVLVHELTHVVLADYFAEHQIPRWADEGIAVLSEPAERRNEMRHWLAQEVSRGRLFSLRQLVSQDQIPADKILGDLFYAQSTSFLEFLLSERHLSESQLLRFVSDSKSRGLPITLARWFPEVATERWDTDWRRWMLSPRTEVQTASEDSPNRSPADGSIAMTD